MGKRSTETNTQSISQEDADAVRRGRTAGNATAGAANNGGQMWAQGLDPLTGQAIQQYGDQYGQYGQYGQQFMDQGNTAYGAAMGTGLGGIGAYMNPMVQQYMQGMNPVYQNQMSEAQRMAQQQSSGPGQAYGQNSRSAILEGQMMGDINRQQGADYGQMQYQAARDSAGMMMGERDRMAQMAQYYSGMGMDALSGQEGVTRNQAMMGDYRRSVAGEQAMDPYRRAAAAQQAIQQGYGQTISSTNTSEKSGDLFGDIMAVGGTIGGLAGLGGGQRQGEPAPMQGLRPGPIQGPTGVSDNWQDPYDPWRRG